jgi:hypothetical protein
MVGTCSIPVSSLNGEVGTLSIGFEKVISVGSGFR